MAGVIAVCILEQMTQSAHVYRANEAVQVFAADQELTLPDVLPGLAATVGKFFE